MDMKAERYKKKYLVRFANLENCRFVEAEINRAELDLLQRKDHIQVLQLINLELKGEVK